MNRRCYRIEVKFVAPQYVALICNPHEPAKHENVVRAFDLPISWLSLKAGDVVGFRVGRAIPDEWRKVVVESIKLDRVSPDDQTGRIVTSVQAWLDGE